MRPETTNDAIRKILKGFFRAYDWLWAVKSEFADMCCFGGLYRSWPWSNHSSNINDDAVEKGNTIDIKHEVKAVGQSSFSLASVERLVS